MSWGDLIHIMIELGFPQIFVNWTMACINTVSYKFYINDITSKILQAKKGLRQGDPISPMLFVLVMEYLHRVLQKLTLNPDFNFHPRCEKFRITNPCFADDLLLFVRGDLVSVQLTMTQFIKFSIVIALYASSSKSKVYFGGDNVEEQRLIQNVVGSMPFYYLVCPYPVKCLP